MGSDALKLLRVDKDTDPKRAVRELRYILQHVDKFVTVGVGDVAGRVVGFIAFDSAEPQALEMLMDGMERMFGGSSDAVQ